MVLAFTSKQVLKEELEVRAKGIQFQMKRRQRNAKF